MTRKRSINLPADSTLGKLVRKGVEGTCIACGQSIRSHYGHRGVWLGCQADKVDPETTFVLAPVNLATRRPVGRPRREVSNETEKPVAHHMIRTRPQFAYTIADRRRKTIDATPAIRHTYEALLKAKNPVTPQQAAKLADAPLEANRIRLNWLAMAGLVNKQEVSE